MLWNRPACHHHSRLGTEHGSRPHPGSDTSASRPRTQSPTRSPCASLRWHPPCCCTSCCSGSGTGCGGSCWRRTCGRRGGGCRSWRRSCWRWVGVEGIGLVDARWRYGVLIETPGTVDSTHRLAYAYVTHLRRQMEVCEGGESPRHKKPVRIWMDGCFDMMHYGHMNAFRQGKALGTYLVVGVNSDETITGRCVDDLAGRYDPGGIPFKITSTTRYNNDSLQGPARHERRGAARGGGGLPLRGRGASTYMASPSVPLLNDCNSP